jgi:lantibiotic biosynthesis dehydratase-like protein
MRNSSVVYLGANIYYWGIAEQRRLLLEGVRPWAMKARQEGWASRFWYCRYDARGPHVFVLFTTTNECKGVLRGFLEARISEFLREIPSREQLSLEQLEKHHRECRGRELSIADGMEGLADNNTYLMFDHESGAYPLNFSAAMPGAAEFWERMEKLCFWTIDQLEQDPTKAAIRWLAAVDRCLPGSGLVPEQYWRLHASTLIRPLRARLETNEAEVLSSLPAIVSESNRRVFSCVWDELNNGSAFELDLAGLVKLIAEDNRGAVERRLRLLREINHLVMGQLGQWVKFEIPIVFYAWQRNLSV